MLTLRLTAALLGLACTPRETPEPPSGPLPAADLGTPGASLLWRALDHLDAGTYHLPGTNLPDGTPFDGVFRLTTGWDDTGRHIGRQKDWTIPLPFPLDMPRPNYSPLGAKLYRKDVEIPFVGGTEATPGSGWFIEAGLLHLVALEDPRTWSPAAELRVPEIAAAIQKRNYDQAGQSPAAFARIDATVGPDTRPTLYVPAPGSATFKVHIPTAATLDFGVALLPDPLLGAKAGDGAATIITVDGEVAWHGSVAPGATFTDARVDLSRWANRDVALAFVSVPDPDATTVGAEGDHDYDYVAWSAPTLVATPVAAADATGGSPAHVPRHVLVVGIDTLRWDALGMNGREIDGKKLDVSPDLDKWGRSAVLFDQAHAPAPRTRPSFRTAFTGRYPLDAVHATTLAEVLAAQGFRTAGFAANVHLVPRFGFNTGFESWRYENGARAGDQVDHALAWQQAHQDEDTFAFVHLMDPHTWYNAPLPWGLEFTGGRTSSKVPALFDRWEILQLTWRHQLDDNDMALIRGRYDGEVAYTSHALAPLLAAADTWHGRTLTIVHADHGEEFWDHGGYEHNHTLYEELVHVLLAVRPPGGWGGGPHHVSSPVGLIDLVPTVLDLLDIPVAARPATDGTSLRPLVDAKRQADAPALTAALAERPLLLGHLMFDKERWGVVFHGWKYVLQTVSGAEELYDLATDPHESHNRIRDAGPERLEELRGALARASGWPLSPGWRLHLRGAVKQPFAVQFDGEIAGSGIFDPESGRTVRANLEWGERPPLAQGDVGRIQPAPDHRGFLFEPSAHADGQCLYVTCNGACPPGRILRVDGTTVPLTEGGMDLGAGGLVANEGAILVPTRTEADVLAAPTDSTQLEQLRALGYIDGGGGRGRLSRSRAANALLGVLPPVVLAWLLTAPVWLDPAHRVLGRAEGEFRDHLWVADLVRRRVLDDHAVPIFFPQAAFPLGLHLYPLDPLTQSAFTLLSIPFGLIPAFALVSTALLAFAGIAGRRLATVLGARAGAAQVAGLLTMVGPPVLGVYADTQTEGMGIGWLILLLAELVDPAPWTTRRVVRLGAFAAALAASAPYQAHGIALVAVPLLVHAVWRRRLSFRQVGVATGIALPVVVLVLTGFLLAETREGGQIHARSSGDADWAPRTVQDDAMVATTLVQAAPTSPRIAYAWPANDRHRPPTTGPRRAAGYVLPALAVLAALRERRARWPLAAALLYTSLALGSARDHDAWTAIDSLRIPLPFDLWYRYYPLGHLAWKPAQYALPAWVLAVAAASSLPRSVLYTGALACALELQLTGPTPGPLPAMTLDPLPAYTDLAVDPDPGGIIEFPCRSRSRAGVDALPFDVLLGQLVHHHPIGETFGRGENPPHQALLDALGLTLGWNVGRGPPLAAAWRAVQKAGFHALLLHGHLLEEHEMAELDEALTAWTAPPRVYTDGVRVYVIPPLGTVP